MNFVKSRVLPAMLSASYASWSPFVNGQARGSVLSMTLWELQAVKEMGKCRGTAGVERQAGRWRMHCLKIYSSRAIESYLICKT